MELTNNEPPDRYIMPSEKFDIDTMLTLCHFCHKQIPLDYIEIHLSLHVVIFLNFLNYAVLSTRQIRILNLNYYRLIQLSIMK